MRCLLMFVAAAVVTSGFAIGQEPSQVPKQLRAYRPFIGTWRYEGPLQEDLPGLAEKGSKIVLQATFRRILNKQVVMVDWTADFAGGKEYDTKELIGWNAADEKVTLGSMNSAGGITLGSVEIDAEADTLTFTGKTTDSGGKKGSVKTVVTKTSEETITWQALERIDVVGEGESPVYTLKRVKGGIRKTAANASEVPQQMKDFGPILGTWRYEGPLLEDVPDMGEKGSKLVIQLSWRRILDKKVVLHDWLFEFQNGKLIGKGLFGWDAADNKLSFGGMDALGAVALGTVEFDDQAKKSTLTSEGVDAKGEKTSFTGVVAKTGKATITWQALERSGGIVEGESPVYTLTRVKRTKGKKAAK